MNNTEFKKIVQESTSKYGFQYCKKKYYCDLDNVIIVINLQKSDFNNCYYINCGFCIKDIHYEIQYPNCNKCDITSRFVNAMNKDEYRLDKLNAEELVMSLEENIKKFIVPVNHDEISKFLNCFLSISVMT